MIANLQSLQQSWINMRAVNDRGINIKDEEMFKGYKERQYAGHKKLPTALAWNYSGNYMITAESSIKLWAFNEVHGLETVSQVKGHDTNISQASFFNLNIFSTVSRDTLKIWDIRQNGMKPIRTEKKPKSDFVSLTWGHQFSAPKFTLLFKDGTISTLDLRGNSLNQTIGQVKTTLQINQILWDQTDNVLFAAGTDSGLGFVTLFDSNLEQVSQAFEAHHGKINGMAIDRKNEHLVTCSDDSLVQIHSLPDMLCERSYSHTDTAYKKASISSNSQYLAVSCDEPFIHFYNIKKGGHAYSMKVNSTNQEVLAWHPEKLILAYIDDDFRKGSSDRGQESYIRLFSPS